MKDKIIPIRLWTHGTACSYNDLPLGLCCDGDGRLWVKTDKDGGMIEASNGKQAFLTLPERLFQPLTIEVTVQR